MANEGLADDLSSLLGMAEDICDGLRAAFTSIEAGIARASISDMAVD